MSTLIADRLNQFAYWLTTAALIMVVAVVILRVLAGYTNLNFFGWTYVTIRRLADPLIRPVRVALIGFQVDPKYAPLATILISLVLWLVVTGATTSILDTIVSVSLAIQQHAVSRVIGHLLIGLIRLYILLIFMRVVFSWVTVSYSNRVMRFLFKTTEPLLGPLRRAIPPVGMFDVSCLVAFILLMVVQAAIQGLFLK